jgi:phage terminase large subunit-like protein
MSLSKDQIRELALSDLELFIKLIHPGRVLGQAHKDLIKWWYRPQAKTHQLLLFPRDHQKSALVAYRVAFELTKNPALRVLYISSTINLATKQLKFIQDIFLSHNYRQLWPEMVNEDANSREKWTTEEISLDHPKRKAEAVRDPSIFTAGLTTNIVGMHCDIAVLDDVVVDSSAYSPEGRSKVADQVSYLSSIAGTDAVQWVVGTRYHPNDLYNDLKNQIVEIIDDTGEIEFSEHLYEIYERPVEVSGSFLWPREQRGDGRWFGFDKTVLAKKKAQYSDLTKFRAQYYNDPNDVSSANIRPEYFQYYNRELLHRESGYWYYKGSRLNVVASVDFAYSTTKDADYTAVVVVGIDAKSNIYILDIDRFKTKAISDYFDHILKLHARWDFRKIRAEVTAAQAAIVESLKADYIRPNGLALSIDEQRPTKKKEDRIEAVLQPRYANQQMWHYQGGHTSTLEEELVYQNPQHDDIKDALASAVEIAVPPSFMGMGASTKEVGLSIYNKKFGGIG